MQKSNTCDILSRNWKIKHSSTLQRYFFHLLSSSSPNQFHGVQVWRLRCSSIMWGHRLVCFLWTYWVIIVLKDDQMNDQSVRLCLRYLKHGQQRSQFQHCLCTDRGFVRHQQQLGHQQDLFVFTFKAWFTLFATGNMHYALFSMNYLVLFWGGYTLGSLLFTLEPDKVIHWTRAPQIEIKQRGGGGF